MLRAGEGVEQRIGPHRTLVTLTLSRADAVGAAALSLTFAAVAWLVAPYMLAMWRWAFTAGTAALELDGRLEVMSSAIVRAPIPVLAVSAASPGRTAMIVGAVLIVALIVAAQRFSDTTLPMAYFIRAIALVLASAVIVFGLGPSNMMDLARYNRAMLHVSLGIWMLTPLVYGLTLFLLDIGWTRKAALIALAMTHLAVFIPLQQLVAMYVVRHVSLLALPLVFVFGSVAPQVAVLIALYAWGASWPGRRP